MDSNVFIEQEKENINGELQRIGKKFSNSEKSQNMLLMASKKFQVIVWLQVKQPQYVKKTCRIRIASPPDLPSNLKPSLVWE